MKYSRFLYGAVVATAAMASAVSAQGTPTRQGMAAGRLDTARIDTAAMNALNRMGAYLRTLNEMQVKATVTTEDVLFDGQKVQMQSALNVIAQRPNRFFIEITDNRQPRQLFYDGKTFTMWAPRLRYYATIDTVPSSINEMAKILEDKYDIDLPLVDLFRWGTPDSHFEDIKSAIFVGPAVIDGVTCEQYAYRQEGLDWQVWIQAGKFPLPLKVVLTTTTDEARPQHEATYTWNLAPSYNDKTFAFAAPPDAKKITFAKVQEARVAKKPGDKK
jgi:hypothetical protein